MPSAAEWLYPCQSYLYTTESAHTVRHMLHTDDGRLFHVEEIDGQEVDRMRRGRHCLGFHKVFILSGHSISSPRLASNFYRKILEKISALEVRGYCRSVFYISFQRIIPATNPLSPFIVQEGRIYYGTWMYSKPGNNFIDLRLPNDLAHCTQGLFLVLTVASRVPGRRPSAWYCSKLHKNIFCASS